MEITDIKMRIVSHTDQLRAFATVAFDGELVVHNIKVIAMEDRLMIAMPSRQIPTGEFKDIVHPANSAFREKITKIVLEEYRKCVEKDKALQ